MTFTYDDPVSPLDLDTWEQTRAKCVDKLICMIEQAKHLDCKMLKQQYTWTTHNPSECKKLYIGSLKRLLRRFQKTTNAKDGKDEFRNDVRQIVSAYRNAHNTSLRVIVRDVLVVVSTTLRDTSPMPSTYANWLFATRMRLNGTFCEMRLKTLISFVQLEVAPESKIH